MTPEQAAAYVTAQAACAVAEIAAMQRANAHLPDGCFPQFGEDDFRAVINRYCISHNAVLQLFQDMSR